MTVLHNVSVWPGLSSIVETLINEPSHPPPAEACCGDFDELDLDEPTPQRDVCGAEPVVACGEFDDLSAFDDAE